jgi:hypothetical protein
MSRSLEAMADWLVESGVTLAGMESTATYWKPVFYALEDRMGTWLLNAGAHEGGARAEVGRAGRGVDRSAARARAGRAVVRALPGDPPAAEPDQVSGCS